MAYDIAEAFRRVEEELISSMIRNLKRHRAEETKEGFLWTQWQVEQLAALEEYRRRNRKKFSSEFSQIHKVVGNLINAAREEGNMRQEEEILKAIRDGAKLHKNPDTRMNARFFRMNDRKMNALIKATQDDFREGERAILRQADDQYRRVIFDAQVYANSGAATYEKAVDMATKDFLRAGIQCVEYSNGARHTLSDYADMAIRTAQKRAYLTGEGEKRQEWGTALVIMNKRTDACPKCLPFSGKVMIDDVWSGGKPDGKHMLISTAMERGLYHPRCRDSHTTYFPEISTAPDKGWTKEELEALEKDEKKRERLIYAENQAEKYDRLARYSLDDGNKQKYGYMAEEWGKEYAKYPLDEGMFTSIIRSKDSGKQTDAIRPHNLMTELSKTEAGKRALNHITNNRIPVQLLYNVDNPERKMGSYDPVSREILIFVDETKSIHETAKAIVHEVVHDRIRQPNSQKQEIMCFLEEELFEGKELTAKVIRSIIKDVKKHYSHLPWR